MVDEEQKQLETAPEESVKEETPEVDPKELGKQEGYREAMEKYKGIQRVVSKVESENKKLKEQIEKLQTTDYTTLLDLAERQAREASDAEGLEKIAALRVAETKKQQQRTLELQLAKQQEVIDSKREEIEQKIKESGQDPDDVKFDNVWLAWELAGAKDGDFSRVDKRLSKLLGTGKSVEKSEESDKRKELEAKGLLKPEGVAPAGAVGSYTRQQIDRMTPDEFAKNYDRIQAAYRAGKIK